MKFGGKVSEFPTNRIFVDGHGWCEVWGLPKVSSKKQREGKYIGESFVHPAKMDVVLCRKIIETYTKPGETVLDPMSGIGTTLVEAALLGRDAIGVELERPFVGTTRKNIKLIERKLTLTPKGKAVVIKGDSRELSRILGGKADAAVFSPPYAESGPWKADGYDDFVKEMRRRTKSGEAKGHYSTPEAELRYIQKAKGGAKVSRDNIGNLKYGKPVDAVVTSPPFADAEHHYKHGLKTLGKNFKGRKAWEEKERVQSEPENIGNLKYGKPVDAIVTSPPFKTSEKGAGIARRWRTGEVNPEDIACKGYRPISRNRALVGMSRTSDDPGNITNMPYGRVDAVISSPPKNINMRPSHNSFDEHVQREKVQPILGRLVSRREGTFEGELYEVAKGRTPEDITQTDMENNDKDGRRSRVHGASSKSEVEGVQRQAESEHRFLQENGRCSSLCSGKAYNRRFMEIEKDGGRGQAEIYRQGKSGKNTVRNGIGSQNKKGENTKRDMDICSGHFQQRVGERPHTPSRKQKDGVHREPSLSKGIDRWGWIDRNPQGQVEGTTFQRRRGTSSSNTSELGRSDIPTRKLRSVRVVGRSSGRGLSGNIRGEHAVPMHSEKVQPMATVASDEAIEVNHIIFSPPYSESMSKRRKGYTTHPELSKTRHMGLGSSDENIGNLRHGKIDVVITSPPYSEGIGHGGGRAEVFKEEKRLYLRGKGSYSEGKGNIGHLKHGKIDTIVTSPPYVPMDDRQNGENIIKNLTRHDAVRGFAAGGSFRGSYGTDDRRNIGNPRKYGKVDSVIFSPPYEKTLTGGGQVEKEGFGQGHTRGRHCFKDGYGKSKQNIGNLPPGKIDSVIFSPPYSKSIHPTGEDPAKVKRKMKERMLERKKQGLTTGGVPDTCNVMLTQGYGKNPDNIGNLPHGKVDSIITSPPYESSLESTTRHTKGGIPGRDKKLGQTGFYPSENKDNIGNLKYGKGGVDSVIFSSPYHDNKSDWDRKSRAVKEGEKVTYSDEVGRERENIGNIHYYDQGKPLSHKYSKAPEGKETYLSAMFKVYAECFNVLKPGGRMVLVIKDFVRNKKVVRLDLDTKRLCEAAGFRWVETKLFRLPRKSFWRTLYERKYPEVDTSLLRFEFVEIFEKPMEAYA